MKLPAFLCGLTLLLTIGVSLPAPSQNLIPNGSFETGYVPNSQGNLPGPWVIIANITPGADTYTFNRSVAGGLLPTDWGNFSQLASAHHGVRFVAGAHFWPIAYEGFGVVLTTPITEGKLYGFSASVTRSNNHTTAGVYDVYISSSMMRSAGQLVGSIGSSSPIGSWAPYSFQFLAPANATIIMLIPRNTAGGATSYLGVDSLELVQVNQAPIADAGEDQIAPEKMLVQLNGGASSDPDQDPLTYAWTQLTGPTATLIDSDRAVCSFYAPEITTTSVDLSFKLTVSDGKLENSALVQVKVTNVNNAPIAQAGPDQTVREGSTVLLDGSASYDVDLDQLSYKWSQKSGPAVILSNDAVAKPTFSAPLVGIAGAVVVFELSVGDGQSSGVDEVAIRVENFNHVPVADAGPDACVAEGAQAVLDGSSSSDADNDLLTFVWQQVSGTTVALNGANTAGPSFEAPQVLADEDLVFKLVVSDSTVFSEPDFVTVKILDKNSPPDCSMARAVPSVLWPPNHKLVEIDIRGIVDPDDDAFTLTVVAITQDEPINGLGDGDTSPDAVLVGDKIYLRAERSGVGDGRVYTIRFKVDDGNGGSCTGVVTVTVPSAKKKPAVDSGQNYDSLGG